MTRNTTTTTGRSGEIAATDALLRANGALRAALEQAQAVVDACRRIVAERRHCPICGAVEGSVIGTFHHADVCPLGRIS